MPGLEMPEKNRDKTAFIIDFVAKLCHNYAMAAFEIDLKPSAIADMDALRKYDATRIANALEKHLRHEPKKESKSRIKRLRGIRNPDYRLLVGQYRVFYTVDDKTKTVVILRVMHKDQTRIYYEELEQ
jgi:mRNA-degrading endonuclease RelE of RelBE toxin-antitoxin system